MFAVLQGTAKGLSTYSLWKEDRGEHGSSKRYFFTVVTCSHFHLGVPHAHLHPRVVY